MGAALLDAVVGDLTVDGGVEGTTETPVATIQTPGDVPGADKLLIARSLSDIRNDSGSNQQPTWRYKFGPTGSLTTLHTIQTIALADDGPTNRYMDASTLFLGGENAVNAQRSMMDHRQGGSNSGNGVYAGGNDWNTSVKSAAVDSSVQNDLVLSAQLPVANSELECRRRGFWCELWQEGGSGSRIVAKDVVDQTVNNTTTETNVFVGTIPSGEWPGRVIKVEQTGTYENNNQNTRTYRIRLYVGSSGGTGGTLVSDYTSASQAASTLVMAAVQRWELMAIDSSTLVIAHKFGYGGPGSNNGAFAAVTTPGGYQTNVVTGLSLSGAVEIRITVTLSTAAVAHRFVSKGVWCGLVSDALASGTQLLDLDGTTATYASSTSAQTVFTKVIPGGTLGTERLLILSIVMDAINNSGSNKQWWWDVFWGGVNIVNAAAGTANPTGATRRAAPLEIWLGGHGVTGEQMCAVLGQPISGALGSGAGSGGNGGSANNSQALATVDSTVDQTLEVKVTFDAADANCDLRYQASMLQLIAEEAAVAATGPGWSGAGAW